MNQKSEKAICNSMATKLYTVMGVCLFFAYILEVVKGARTVGEVVILLTLDVVPIVICWVLNNRNPENDIVKHVMAIGYGLFCLGVTLITHERLVFAYMIPMVIVIMLFNDMRFSITVSSLVFALSVVHAIKTSVINEWTPSDVSQTEIELAAMGIIAVFVVIINKVIIQLNTQKMQVIDEAGKKTAGMLDDILSISNEMVNEVISVSDKMALLETSSEETYTAMQEVSSGSTETAESVQNQLYKTEEIQNQIARVSDASSNIASNVDTAVNAIHEGRDNVKHLIEQSNASEIAGNNAIKEVEELAKSTDQMHEIVELIKNVATQTSLLSLNASIEAARAGEAGRGFAVVATEISNLAGQTQTATGNISELIEGLSKEMSEVVEAINLLVESNRSQNESANITAGSFEKIVDSTREIRSSSKELASIVTTLADANQEIVESIQTISAITEEVSAHSNTTCEASEQNRVIVNDVMDVVDTLKENAEKLKNIQ